MFSVSTALIGSVDYYFVNQIISHMRGKVLGSGVSSATMTFDTIKAPLSVLTNLIMGLFRQFKFGNEMPIFFPIGSTKFFLQCFHYRISIFNICDILYRLSFPLVFEPCVIGHPLKQSLLVSSLLSCL